MKFLSAILFVIVLISESFGFQENRDESSQEPYFQLQSIHLDATSLIYILDLSLSSDFEIYKTDVQSFGIQAGYSYLIAGNVGGSEYGSPFNDLNLLAYTSIGYNKLITSQVILGYAYRMSSKSYAVEYPVGGLKAGISFILNLDKSIKFYVKYSGVFNSADFGMSAVGLGLSIGWSR
jgi:hypothetical protein